MTGTLTDFQHGNMKAAQASLNTFFISSILVMSLIFEGCDPSDNRLSIQNKTGETIYYLWSEDTINWMYNNWREISKDSTMKPSMHGRRGWEGFFQNGQYLFIFFEETVKHNRDTIRGSIRNHYRYDKRIDLTLDDIKRMNWRIVVE